MLLLEPIKEFLSHRRVIAVYFKGGAMVGARGPNMPRKFSFKIASSHMLKVETTSTVKDKHIILFEYLDTAIQAFFAQRR